jgi:phosphoribosylglycinamide formyltransferase 2
MSNNIKVVNQVKNFVLKNITPPNSKIETRVLVVGAGETAKGIILELKKYNLHVMAFAKYNGMPAMEILHGHDDYQVVDIHRSSELRRNIIAINPDLTIFIADNLDDKMISDLELKDKFKIFPSKFAVISNNNRTEIKKVLSEEFEIEITPYKPISHQTTIQKAFTILKAEKLVLKSFVSGKLNMIIHKDKKIPKFDDRVLVEQFVEFDAEFSVPIVFHSSGMTYLDPIQHEYSNGFYSCVQPVNIHPNILLEAMRIATKVVKAMSNYGLFFVKFFVIDDKVIFNNVIIKPHQLGHIISVSTGFYTQEQLYVRAMLGYPLPMKIKSLPSASVPIIANKKGIPTISNLEEIYKNLAIDVKLFSMRKLPNNKPTLIGEVLAQGPDVRSAQKLAKRVSKEIKLSYL